MALFKDINKNDIHVFDKAMSSLYHLEFHNKSVAPVRGDAIKIMRLY
jgi:hypothetical protein